MVPRPLARAQSHEISHMRRRYSALSTAHSREFVYVFCFARSHNRGWRP